MYMNVLKFHTKFTILSYEHCFTDGTIYSILNNEENC
jgi:hypothetical protein